MKRIFLGTTTANIPVYTPAEFLNIQEKKKKKGVKEVKGVIGVREVRGVRE